MKKAAIGVDIGGTNTVLGIVDMDGKIIARNSMPTKTSEDYRPYMDTVADLIYKTIASAGSGFEIAGIGVGAPK
ncbi:MAG: ROK family protein, partial [Bacteroidetes bacterium]|nr:ROK family protein [Bacteroidota bacterium]